MKDNQSIYHRYLNMNVECDLQALVPSGAKAMNHNYCVECPLCKKYLNKDRCMKLYIRDDFESGHCHRCGSNFFSPRPDPNSGSWKSRFNKLESPIITYSDESIDCSYYHESNIYDSKGIEYLDNRWEYLSDNYLKFGFRFRPNLVVIPFKKNGDGDVYFYQCRSTNKNSENRYYIPKSENKPIYIAPNSNLSSNKIILSEGVFGSIAIGKRYPEYKSIATLGSTITNYQLYQLDKLNITEIVLYYDNNGINSSVLDIVTKKFPFSKFQMLESLNGDPQDDYLKEECPVMSESTELSFSDKFKLNLNNILHY